MESGIRKPKPKRRRTTPTGAYSGKTKYDRWLEQCAENAAKVAIVIAPPAPYPYPSGAPDNCKFTCFIMQVDRYAVLVQFIDVNQHDGDDDGEDYIEDDLIWWIAKDAIRASARIS